MPTFPEPAPESPLATIAIGRDVEKPHTSVVIMVLIKPMRMTVLRPNRSEATPHGIPVKH